MTGPGRPGGASRSIGSEASGMASQGGDVLTRLSLVALGLVIVVPTGAIALSRGFDGLYGQDAFAYFEYATTSVRQSILHLAPLEPFFWPPGYPLLVAVTS
ncbi:MAG TPA: hypothetical protein VGE94_07565, partial [Chloroflexota bacterium]